jgi:putative ABC transport system permease protein
VVADVKTPTETINSSVITSPVAINLKRDFPEIEDAVRIAPEGFLVKKGNIKFQEEKSVLADSTLFNVFDFPLIAGNKNTALVEPMSIVISQTAAKKYFGNTNPMGQELQVTGAGINAKITGVMKDIPRNSQIEADMILSQSSSKLVSGFPMSDSEWTNHTNYTYILVKPHTNVKALAAKFPAFQEFHHGIEAKKLQMQDYLSLEPLQQVYLHY